MCRLSTDMQIVLLQGKRIMSTKSTTKMGVDDGLAARHRQQITFEPECGAVLVCERATDPLRQPRVLTT